MRCARRLAEIMEAPGIAKRGYFEENHLDPLLRAGVVAMTNPENPRAANQRYVLTGAGAKLKVQRVNGEAERDDED